LRLERLTGDSVLVIVFHIVESVGPLFMKDVIGISDSEMARGLESNGRMMNCLKPKTLKRLKAKKERTKRKRKKSSAHGEMGKNLSRSVVD
jgi:hypothetical protein